MQYLSFRGPLPNVCLPANLLTAVAGPLEPPVPLVPRSRSSGYFRGSYAVMGARGTQSIGTVAVYLQQRPSAAVTDGTTK
jgi:hypothetical protein